MTKEKPVIFSGPMVQAILDGSKTQTRRVMKPQVVDWHDGWEWKGHKPNSKHGAYASNHKHRVNLNIYVGPSCPYGVKGDRLWVRETFTLESNFNIDGMKGYPPPFKDGRPVNMIEDEKYGDYWEQPHYRASDPEPELSYDDMDGPGCRWKPSIHMPRWASRINLEIIDIRVEQLQEISEADAKAEGMQKNMEFIGFTKHFKEVWDSINGKSRKDGRDISWSTNPWVWVVEFKKI